MFFLISQLTRENAAYSATSSLASSSLPVTLSFSSLASPNANPSAATTPSSGRSSPTTTAPSNSDSNSSSSSSTNVGAIAGGVVGGVVGLALLAFLAWFLLRRRKNKQAGNPYLLQDRHEVDGNGVTKYRMDAPVGANQPPGYHEVDGQTVYRNELQAQQIPVELPAGKQ